jgi:hypothetical protein
VPPTATNNPTSSPRRSEEIPRACDTSGGTGERRTDRALTEPAYFVIRLCLWLLTHTFYRIRVRGLENLPRRGPALLVCNHISFIDPFLIGACTRRSIRFLMDRRFYKTTGIHWLAKLMGAIPIGGDDPPRKMVESLREAQARLRDSTLPRLWLPRKENFFPVDSLPILGSGKLDLKKVKETAKRLAGTHQRMAEPIV